jgi:hypothetical protein
MVDNEPVYQCSFNSPVFQSCLSKVDATIASSAAGCYGQFVTLTEPILLQSITINCLAEEFHSSSPFQFTAISSLLNFQ